MARPKKYAFTIHADGKITGDYDKIINDAVDVIETLRDALINIAKTGGTCWDGKRECSDSQEVASRALKKALPGIYKAINDLPYEKIKVFKNGRVKWK